MTKDMTQGQPLRLILLFAVPMMLGSLFQQFYNLADTIIVGRFVGVDALAAVGSVGGLSYLVLGFVNGIACGFAIPLARCFGAKDDVELRRYTANSVWLSLIFAAVLTVVTVALTRPILVLTNTPSDIIDLADVYIRTIFAGIPFTLLYNVTSAFMRALGTAAAPVFPAGGQRAEHRPGYLLCAGVPAGVFGAAIATVISQAVAGLWSLAYMVKNFRMLGWSREEGRFSTAHCAKLCMMGLPMGLQCSITAVGNIVLQTAVNGLGSAIVAAMTAGGKAGQILSVPLESIGTAMTTYTAARTWGQAASPGPAGSADGPGHRHPVQHCLLHHLPLLGCAGDRSVPGQQRGRHRRHHGQRPGVFVLEQRLLHPPGGADCLPLLHPGPGLFGAGHVCRGV